MNLVLTTTRENGSEGAPSAGLVCPECKSDDITDVRGEYTCRQCGLVLDMKVTVYNAPYDKRIEHRHRHTKYSTTQIGSSFERINHYRFRKLNTLNKSSDFGDRMEQAASVEINRIFNSLQLPHTLKKSVKRTFSKVRGKLPRGTKFRSPQKLVPVVIYYVHKAEGYSIDQRKLLEYARVSKKDFQESKLVAQKYIPAFVKRERLPYIMREISLYSSELGLGMDFYHLSVDILRRFWEILRNTTDAVATGVAMSLSALTVYEGQIPVSTICNKLNIAMGAVQNQVKNKLFKALHVPGFTSLVKSASIIHRVLVKAGILPEESPSTEDAVAFGEEAAVQISEVSGIQLTDRDFISFYDQLDGFEDALHEALEHSSSPVIYPPSIPLSVQVFRIEAFTLLIATMSFGRQHVYLTWMYQRENGLFRVFSKKDPPSG